MALNNLKRVDMPLNKETKPCLNYYDRHSVKIELATATPWQSAQYLQFLTTTQFSVEIKIKLSNAQVDRRIESFMIFLKTIDSTGQYSFPFQVLCNKRLIDFIVISTRLGLFYVKTLKNRINYTFIFTFFCSSFLSVFYISIEEE